MKIYTVGGAVRDELLGLPVQDRDYVVVGATPEDMVSLGYKPVGRDFPVFLHPETHEEYALARTERKTARGYHGFAFHAAPDVTLEQDLARRDLTINAMARDEDGLLVDPHNGAEDVSAGILRHVSPAFAEDPVRILRVARFAARFGFDIAPETMELMRGMVESREADALVPERVWQELARGLMEERPSRMFEVLRECGALARVAPEIDGLYGEQEDVQAVLDAVDSEAESGASLEVRFAVLCRALDPYAVDSLANRLKVPGACRDLALLAARHTNSIADAEELSAEAILELLTAADVWRRPDRFAELVSAALAGERDTRGIVRRLEQARAAAAAVDAGAIAKSTAKAGGGASPNGSANADDIRERIAKARLGAIEQALGAA
jgi:tRNA nucleotidyltransferase (CCA-adding enzyme)